MTPEIDRIREEADAAEAEIVALCSGLDDSQLAWREAPNRWSLAENVAHLRKTIELCLPALDKAIADARQRGLLSNGPFEQGIMGRFFVWYVEPPPKIKLPAPKVLVPVSDMPVSKELPAFLAAQQLVLNRLANAEGVDLRRATFKSPFASFVKMDLLALVSVFTAHERRHIVQMRRVRQKLDEMSKGA
jgi:hypothetical protein